MPTSNTNQLETQLDDLLARYKTLREENQTLRSSTTQLETERSKLLEKNELATSKIEAMIARLKNMESGND